MPLQQPNTVNHLSFSAASAADPRAASKYNYNAGLSRSTSHTVAYTPIQTQTSSLFCVSSRVLLLGRRWSSVGSSTEISSTIYIPLDHPHVPVVLAIHFDISPDSHAKPFSAFVPNSTTRTPATYGHVVMLYNTTNRQAHNNSTTCCTTNLPHRNARAQHLDMSRCWDVANFCPLVVSLLHNKL